MIRIARNQVLLLIVGVGLIGGCSDNITHPGNDHGCHYMYNSVWTNLSFKLDHSDTRSCPDEAAYGTNVMTGGTVYEPTKYPTSGYANSGKIRAWNNYDAASWFGSGRLGNDDFEYFQWGPPAPGSSQPQDWQAQLWASYTTSENPDFGEFVVDVTNNTADAIGVAEIKYFAGQF
jgi:hypothetical protein